MAIFNPKKSSSTTPSPPQRPRPMERQSPDAKPRSATYIAAGSKVTGEITGSAEVLVDGVFQGRLDLDSNVVVGREGRVDGEITARAVRVEGKVTGDVRGHERVEVMASGTLEGDISASRVVIAEGAFFKGKVEMSSQQAASDRPGKGKPPQGGHKGHKQQGGPSSHRKGQGQEPKGPRKGQGSPTAPGSP